MLINQIDELFDTILNKFYEFLHKKAIFKKYNKDSNFVLFQEDILITIEQFVKTLSSNDILQIIKKEIYLDYIYNIIKRYCAFYIYLGIGYYYDDGRDLFITNIIEISKNQKDTVYQIKNFFNSDNNSKIIKFFSDIKNILSLIEFKTIDKIKIIISNNPIKFNNIIKLFSELGEDYIINNFLLKDNFHNILKTFIFRLIYLKEEKLEINKLLNEIEKEEGEYKYIEIIVSNTNKIVDFNIIQKFLNIKQIRSGLAEEIYNYLVEMKESNELIIKENQDFINYLFSNKIIIPITEEFLRFHKDSEKYEFEGENKKDDTKIKYVVNKLNNIRNYYSNIINKNAKLKLEIERYFYKNLDPRMAILFNDNEEIKIIQKLIMSENAADADLLIDLQNIRKYAYVNFKNVSNDHIKLRTSNTIEAIRSINLKKKKLESIETRIGHTNIDLNVIGIAFNPSRLNINKKNKILQPIECFTIKDLVNVKNITKKDNGFLSFIKILQKVAMQKNNNKLFYWIFNNLTDIPKFDKYIDYNKNDSNKNIKIMLAEIYNIWTDLVKTKFLNYIEKINNITIWQLDNLLKNYEIKYFNFNFNPEIKNELINTVLLKKFKELKITEDETDNIIPGKRNKIIELPVADIKINKKNIIILNENKKIIEKNMEQYNNAICHHYIKWDNLKKMSKSKQEDFNQQIFEFVKKYVKENDKGQRICKSCNELLMLDKYIYEGTYIKELDQFMTTSMAVHQQLTDLPQYMNLKRTINNLGKNLEKIAYITDLTMYIGNNPITKLYRKTVIKDTIDLILLHTNYLKNQPKDRIEQSAIKYNIKKEYTNLFFFELKDEIFLTSSLDTDYYKLIKYNNVMSYLLFVIISELNSGQILNLKNDKRCNFFFYSKFGDILFKDLYLRINEKEKILLTQIPLLTYVIYYFSCILTNNRLWLWNDNNTIDKKEKNLFNINIQKSIIYTIIDLINSIIEANLQKEKNFLYEIISTRFFIKLKHTFNDDKLIKRINDNINKKINYDDKTKKFSFINKKINYISLQNDIIFENNINKKYCDVTIKKLNKLKYRKNINKINSLTNCDDGKFHIWIIDNGNMICKLCNKYYNKLLITFKEKNKTDTDNDSIYYNKLNILFIKKLTKKHCLSGELHQFNMGSNICTLCKINPDIYEYSEKELFQLENNINEKNNIEININFKKIKENDEINTNNKIYYKKIINKFNKRFKTEILKKYSSNNLENYIIDFINKIIEILGNKIKIKNKTIYIKDTLYTIDHDYLGNSLKTSINILSSDNLILTYNDHPLFNKDVLYYKDKANKLYVYYDIVTLQYLGYSENNKEIIQNKNNASIKVEYSIKDCLLLMGLENIYTNIYHFDSSLINNFNPNINYIINNLIRNRIVNLKQIINRTLSMINSVNNHGKVSSIYNIKEKEIINEFITKLKKFNLKDKNNSNGVFKHSKYICNLINFKKITNQINIKLNKNYINNNFLNIMQNVDSQLIFYIIMNFNRLLDYNPQTAIQSELAHFIIRIIQFNMEIYLKENNYDIRKFEYLILGDVPYVDETVKPIGLYQELFSEAEIDQNKIKENNYDAQEAINSLDIDDYEIDEDIDGSAEALDGFEI